MDNNIHSINYHYAHDGWCLTDLAEPGSENSERHGWFPLFRHPKPDETETEYVIEMARYVHSCYRKMEFLLGRWRSIEDFANDEIIIFLVPNEEYCFVHVESSSNESSVCSHIFHHFYNQLKKEENL